MKSPIRDAINTVLHAIHSSGVELTNAELAAEVDCSWRYARDVREEWTPYEDESEYDPVNMTLSENTDNPFKGKLGNV